MVIGSYAYFLFKRGDILTRHALHRKTIDAQQNQHQPSAALQQWRCFAEAVSSGGLKPLQRECIARVGKDNADIMVPDVELYFNFTGLNLFSPAQYDLRLPKIHLAGLHHYDQNAYSNMSGSERNGGFCIVFRPCGFFNLFRIKSSEFSNDCITGDYVFKGDIIYLWEKLSLCRDIKSMRDAFESFFSGQAKGYHPDSCLIDQIVRRMDKEGGMIRVSELCDIYNITPRSLERHFLDETGITAREFLQIFRINRAIRMLAEILDANLAALSYLSGYFDQSHFIRDIRKITGISPGELQASETGRKTVHNRLFIKNQ